MGENTFNISVSNDNPINSDFISESSIDDLYELKSRLSEIQDNIRTAISEKEIADLDYTGKFITYKENEFSEDVTYMHVRNNFISKTTDKGPRLVLQGHAFSSSFSQYEDENWSSWTTWDDIYIDLYEFADSWKSKIGRLSKNRKYVSKFIITEITEEEFRAEFGKMMLTQNEQFNTFIERDKLISKTDD